MYVNKLVGMKFIKVSTTRIPFPFLLLYKKNLTVLSNCFFNDSLKKQTSKRSYSLQRQRLFNTTTSKKDESKQRPFYLDYQATTPVDPRVLDAMLPFLVHMYGNPHSRSHAFGWEADQHVENARKEVADLISAHAREIIFTSGATESNNIAIKGLASFMSKAGSPKKHIITTQIEHKCVLASCRDVEEQFGWKITYLPVESDGVIDLEKLEKAMTSETALVSIMFINNEIGVMQPIKEIGELCRKKNVLFHSDVAQGCGKLPLSMKDIPVDMMSISGHKMYGPKGIGALFIRQRKPRIRLNPIFSGGGQERGLRSGTLSTPLVVGLGRAASIAAEEMDEDLKHVTMLANRLQKRLEEKLPHIVLNGSSDQRYFGNLNFSFAAVEGESLLMSLKHIALSSGSACTSASLEPSYVLRAIGVGEDLAHTSLRFGFGRFTTVEEVDACADAVIKNVNRLREMSPLWDVIKDPSISGPVWT